VSARADQIALLAGLAHDRLTAKEIGEALDDLSESTGDPACDANVREARRSYERAVKVPPDLVRQIARASSIAREAWEAARADNDFDTFAPHLATLVDLRRQTAHHIGFEDEPYDALLDEFEPGSKTRDIAAIFSELRAALVPLAQAIVESPTQPNTEILTRRYPVGAQKDFGTAIARDMGFDFESGRLDQSTHPFTLGSYPGDVRLTTRYDERFLPMSVFGTMHEVGHGLYQQGLPADHVYTPLGSPVSLGIHESQSRMWENMVGRSRPFWEHYFPQAQRCFSEALSDVSLDDFVAAINSIQASCIRVEADEVTYNLHIILRFEIEREMIAGRLNVREIPDAWNAAMKNLLGATPPDNAQGCLQDIHWSMAAFGYFPTYTLGNLYAAQFYAAALKANPELPDRISKGDLATLLDWLRDNIHCHGQRYRARELTQLVSGKPLSVEPFMQYLRDKYTALYGL
jgi:carboxypeptidase Taq